MKSHALLLALVASTLSSAIPKPEDELEHSKVAVSWGREYKIFNQENIEIPFPQRTIHIQEND